MTKEEFKQRVGEADGEYFEAANKLYMLLPDMDKYTFCALWVFDTVSSLSVFAELKKFAAIYKEAREKMPIIFLDALKPFHATKQARDCQEKLEKVAAGIKAAEKLLA